MTDQEIIDVVTAHRDGAVIEQKFFGCDWQPLCPPWTFTLEWKYRIKPETPKKIKLYAYINKISGAIYFSKGDAVGPEAHRAPWLDGEVEE